MAQLKSTVIQGDLVVSGTETVNKIIKSGGTADQILLANGDTLAKSTFLTADSNLNASKLASGTVAASLLPSADGSNPGITKVYPAASCTTYTSDSDGACTPAAVKKAVEMFHGPTMVGATSSNNGTKGIVPAPAVADRTKFLRGDGTWQTVAAADGNSAHSHSAGVGLALGDSNTGGTSGTVNYKAKLRSETALTIDSAAATTTNGRVYPVAVDKTGYLSVNVPWTNVNSSYLTAHQTIKQDGITGATANRFGTCSTAAATAAKTVSITSGTFNLEAGAKVTVKFTNANTAGTPTLNVNNTGAKAIFYRNSKIASANYWVAGDIVNFVYDGTNWCIEGFFEKADDNTKTSAGTGDATLESTDKLYLVGGKSRTASGTTTYTADHTYINSDKRLYNNNIRVAHDGITGTTTKDVGGIPKGTTYEDAEIRDVLNALLFPYVPPSNLSITTTASSGTFEYGTTVKVTSVKPSFTKGSKNITSIKIGTSSGGSELYSGTSATSGTSITIPTDKQITYNGSTGGTIYCTISDGTTTLTPATASVSYKYYDYSKLTTSATAQTTGATKQSNSDADNTYSYTAGQYLWLYSRSSSKKIQTYVAGSWADVTTTTGSAITLTLASGATATYYPYRTDKFTASGSARYRLANKN